MQINIQPFVDMKLKQMAIMGHVTFVSQVLKSPEFKSLGGEIAESLAGSLGGFAQYIQAKDADGNPIVDASGNPVMKIESEWEVLGRMQGSAEGMQILSAIIKSITSTL